MKWFDAEGDPLGIVQEIEIWLYKQTEDASTRFGPRKWDAQNNLGFWDRNRSPNPSQKKK